MRRHSNKSKSFEISPRYRFLNNLSLTNTDDDDKCSSQLRNIYSQGKIKENSLKYLNLNLFEIDDNEDQFWKNTCSKLKKYSPRPSVIIDHNNNPTGLKSLNSTIFNPGFLRFLYIPDSSKSVTTNDNYDNVDQRDQQEQWELALKNHDSRERWMKKIYSQLYKLSECETGHCILQLIGSFWERGQILFTNKNSTRLSANVYTNIINIPSVPRFICYFGENDTLVHSEMWMALGHELLHLVHKKFGIHDQNGAQEEKNTVQGDYDLGRHVDFAVFNIHGKNYNLTENQFRSENNIDPRNGYGSIAVCSSFDKRGCNLFNKYGDGTCKQIQKRK